MKALISSIEPVKTGWRVAQVEKDGNVFSVADGLFWVDCDENTNPDDFWYDPSIKKIVPLRTIGLQII